MKRMIMIIAVTLFSVSAMAQLKNATLTASGLTCSMCSKAIYDGLKKISFVEDVQANIKNSSYVIRFKDGQKMDPDALSKAVTDAGFSVAKLQLTLNFDQQKIANDTHLKLADRTLHFVNVKDQVLSGETTVTLVDKNFLTSKEFKKYANATKMKCFTTGVADNCCDPVAKKAERIYHVTI